MLFGGAARTSGMDPQATPAQQRTAARILPARGGCVTMAVKTRGCGVTACPGCTRGFSACKELHGCKQLGFFFFIGGVMGEPPGDAGGEER